MTFAFHVPLAIVPTVVMAPEPAEGAAPIVLYEIVIGDEPLKFVLETVPVPALLKEIALEVFASIVISAVPLKSTPLIVLIFNNASAVAALPVVF